MKAKAWLTFTAVIVLAMMASIAFGANGRTTDVYGLMKYLNGSPTKLGTIYNLDGGVTTSAGTDGGSFTLNRGTTLVAVCANDSNCIEGTTVSTAHGSTAYGFPCKSETPTYFVMLPGSGTTTFTCASTSTLACDIFEMW